MYQKPKSLGAILVLFLTLSFAAVHGTSAFRLLSSAHFSLIASSLLIFKTSIEIGAAFYGIAALFSALAYLLLKERTPEWQLIEDPPPVGIFYLCCEDFDRAALQTLLTLKYRGKISLIVHDDSESADARKEVDRALRSFCIPANFEVLLLRRPKKEGGKSGAVNYILHQTGYLYQYFLLCDNDSTIIDPLAIEKALPYFRDDRVAIVQCRSVPVDNGRHCPVNRFTFSID
jgi:hypothetical protein